MREYILHVSKNHLVTECMYSDFEADFVYFKNKFINVQSILTC